MFKIAPPLLALALLSACVTPNSNSNAPALNAQQQAAYDTLFHGCLDERLYASMDTYIKKRVALAQVDNYRYESFMCDCIAESAAKRPYVASMLARVRDGGELNSAGQNILKNASFAALSQCTATWLDKSGAALIDRLGADAPAETQAPSKPKNIVAP